MKTMLITLLLCITHVNAELITDAVVINQKIEETLLSSGASGRDISWITSENRSLVINNLLEKYSHPELYSLEYIREALVRAGHWDTILGLIENLKDPKKDTTSLRYANEEIIPYLMPLVYTGSTSAENSSGSDVIRRSPRSNAIYDVLGKIWQCEEFPQKTQKWAKDMSSNNRSNGPTDEAWVGLITSWWEHNQDAILEKRYKDATWLPTYKGVPINRTPEEMQMIVDYFVKENAARLAMRIGPADAPGVLPRSTTSRPGETAVENVEEPPSMLLWIGMGAIVTAVGGFLWRRLAAKNA